MIWCCRSTVARSQTTFETVAKEVWISSIVLPVWRLFEYSFFSGLFSSEVAAFVIWYFMVIYVLFCIVSRIRIEIVVVLLLYARLRRVSTKKPWLIFFWGLLQVGWLWLEELEVRLDYMYCWHFLMWCRSSSRSQTTFEAVAKEVWSSTMWLQLWSIHSASSLSRTRRLSRINSGE